MIPVRSLWLLLLILVWLACSNAASHRNTQRNGRNNATRSQWQRLGSRWLALKLFTRNIFDPTLDGSIPTCHFNMTELSVSSPRGYSLNSAATMPAGPVCGPHGCF